MNHCDRVGFSLVEVVIAVGVFAAGVIAAIVLMSTSADATSTTLQANGAVRVAESAAELVRLWPWEETVARLAPDADPIQATREGRVGVFESLDTGDVFYEVSLRRNEYLSPVDNDSEAAFLAFAVQVSWPVHDADMVAVAMNNREKFTLNASIRR